MTLDELIKELLVKKKQIGGDCQVTIWDGLSYSHKYNFELVYRLGSNQLAITLPEED